MAQPSAPGGQLVQIQLRSWLRLRIPFIAVVAGEDAQTLTVFALNQFGDTRRLTIAKDKVLWIRGFDVRRGRFGGD